MDYFIADTHFGHQNIIRFCDRPFPDAETMDRALIANWNERVNDDDRVYILGDLLYRCLDPIGILSQLKGRKHLLVGNHDHSWLNAPGARDFFASIADYAQVNDGAHVLIMSHYPMLSYYHEHRSNVFMIHGHIHNDTGIDYWPALVERERVLNAGADINGFRPVTFVELVANNRKFKQEHALDQPRPYGVGRQAGE